jgi:hypothetical protein
LGLDTGAAQPVQFRGALPYCSKVLVEFTENPLIQLSFRTGGELAGFRAKRSTNHGDIAPLSCAYFDKKHDAFMLLKFALANMALHARALPALAGPLYSASRARKVAWMKLMPVPAWPPNAQPRANATRFSNSQAGKGMHTAHALVIVSGNAGFWQRQFQTFSCQRNGRLSMTPCR